MRATITRHSLEISELEKQLAARDAQIAALRAHVAQLTEALSKYADAGNWQCPRCGGTDALNCFMGRWQGPCRCSSPESGDAHGWDVARGALALTPSDALAKALEKDAL